MGKREQLFLNNAFLSWGWLLSEDGSNMPRVENSGPARHLDIDTSISVLSHPPLFKLWLWQLMSALIDASSKRVSCPVRPEDGLESTRSHFLADQVLPRLIAHEGALVLHAAGIRLRQGAVILLGKSGLGKSTLATAFMSDEDPLLSDDAVVVDLTDAGATVQAVYPGLRLLPEAIEALYPGSVPVAPTAHYTSKLRINVPTATDPGRHPVAGLVFLASPTADDALGLRRMTVAETCMELIANSFALDPTDGARARLKLAQASAVASQIPAYALSYPREYDRLPDVKIAIMNALATATSSEARAEAS